MALNQPDFRTAVLLMDNDLHEEDVESLKFLCHGLVMGKKLKPVKAVHELASLLNNLNHVSEEDFFLLADLLQYIRRVDILEKIGFMEEQVVLQRRQHGSKIHAFYVLLFEISEDLKKEDVNTAAFIYGKVPRSQAVSHGLDLFSLMIQRRDIGPEDVTQLVTLFQKLKRPDFVDKLNEYKETGGQSVILEIEEAFQMHRKKLAEHNSCSGDMQGVNSLAAELSTSEGSSVSAQATPSEAGNTLPGNARDIGVDAGSLAQMTATDSSMESDDQTNGSTGPDRPGMSPYEPHSDSPLQYYRMDRKPRGWCIIINNKDFTMELPQAVKLENRPHSDLDKARLEETFKRLNFKVKTEENLSSTKMVQRMKRMALKNHSNFDCFVCCILSHGTVGAVYGRDGIKVPIEKLTSCVRASTCPSLAGKPKLFFLQACQGLQRMEGVAVPSTEEVAFPGRDGPEEQVPDDADFLLGYPTGPGFPAYYNKTQGGLYISKLTEMLNEYAYRYHILEILTMVNNEVGKENPKGWKQIPLPAFGLRKLLIFR